MTTISRGPFDLIENNVQVSQTVLRLMNQVAERFAWRRIYTCASTITTRCLLATHSDSDSFNASVMATNYENEKQKYRSFFEDDVNGDGNGLSTELQNTPIFSLGVRYLDAQQEEDEGTVPIFANTTKSAVVEALPQYALLGLHVGDHSQIGKREPIMLNTASPNSTFICGSQGSGKSYTLACMLENYLLPDTDYGPVANPVAGVVFHYDSEGSSTIAEVASLCSRGIKVRILVSRSNYKDRCAQYMELAGKSRDNMEVLKLAFKDNDLNVERMQRLMAFSEPSEGGVPLYVSVIHNILRQMNETDDAFTFDKFQYKLRQAESGFAANQKSMLNLRMDIMQSFRPKRGISYIDKRAGIVVVGEGEIPDNCNVFKAEPGTLTVVDLTDPFVDAATACILFDICLGLFKQNAPKDGLVVALDEAHRYMDTSAAASNFTKSLVTTIRLQRHTGTRVIVATQEPTISADLMDLCSTTIVHHFNSPAWFTAIKDHLAAASDANRQEMFNTIVKLNAGQSLVFSPSSFLYLDQDGRSKLGTGFMKMKTRTRKGVDSGKSKMAGGNGNGDDLIGLRKELRGLDLKD